MMFDVAIIFVEERLLLRKIPAPWNGILIR
jgi:hypothetical protein